MLMFAKGDLPLNNRVSVADLFESLRQQAEPVIERAGAYCAWDNQCAADAWLTCNRETLIGAALNLIENAIQAGAPVARLKVRARLVEKQLSLIVIDTGEGMSAAELKHIGEPFHTTRDQGTGLGVSVVKSVAQAHGGAFYLRSKAGWGTCAELLIPLAKQRQRSDAAEESTA